MIHRAHKIQTLQILLNEKDFLYLNIIPHSLNSTLIGTLERFKGGKISNEKNIRFKSCTLHAKLAFHLK